MEAQSCEDGGQGISLNVYVYNVEPGVSIDYATGANQADGTMGSAAESAPAAQSAAVESYVLNTNSMKTHHPDCSSVAKMSAKNRQDVEASLDELLAQGYTTCGSCF